MWTREQADIILVSNIREPALTDAEFAVIDTSKEIYGELSKILQNQRGGVGSAYQKLKADAKINGIDLDKKEYSNVYLGAVLD
ncbi:MAG: hypothetical protein LBH29_03110 [Elusimicrobiota bacterium]|nr:hypothetical protein [Elusimicrobiota bacterium]